MSYRGDGTGGGRGCGGGRGYGGRGGGGRGYGRRGGDGGGGRGYGGRGGSGGGGRGYGGRGGDGGGGGGRGQYQAPSVGVLSKQTRQEAAVISDVQKKLSLSAPPTAGAGGRNTVLADAIGWNIPILIDKVTIVFGADVTHAPAGEDSSPSIAAVVASMDWPEVTKYRGLVSVQGHREEIIQDLYKEVIDPKMGKGTSGRI